MKEMHSLKFTLITSLIAGAIFFSDHAVSQDSSSKQLLVGTWSLTSADSVKADGTRVAVFGPSPKGTMIFTEDGRFALIQMRGDLPKLAANNRDQGTPEEYKAVVSGSIAYFGTYVLNEAEKLITLKLEGSTYANLLGAEQKRIITSLTAGELTFTNPRNPAGMTLEVGWRRAP
jgi:hypothetical protein